MGRSDMSINAAETILARPSLQRNLALAVARAGLALERVRRTPSGRGDRTRRFVWLLANSLDERDLRRELRDAEAELYACEALKDGPIAFWWVRVELLRMAIDARRRAQASRPIRRSGGRGRVDFEEIRRRVDIVEYVGRYTQLRKQGRSFVGRCLFHVDERRPNLVVWPEPPVFKCWACGARGDVISFRRLLAERGLR